MHEQKTEENVIRQFFADVYELFVKVSISRVYCVMSAASQRSDGKCLALLLHFVCWIDINTGIGGVGVGIDVLLTGTNESVL